ncbi:MAG TPA: lipid-binding SYLF domain-containing protein [Bryobacteraceae bacterium]|jgi:lipid-binding SYLF domain-containing protein|nr:lipid-binding SYLF domain-containing protein [Bryobacteraceae bacterium]
MKMRMFAALLATLLPATVSAASDAPKRLRSAAEAFKEVMGIPDKAIPQELLEKAECIVIIPDLKKGAFIVGGKYGKGFVSCRKKNGVGWSAPGSIRIEGGSVGFQIGASEMDVFMLVMNDRGMDRLLGDKFTLGADATVAAGPVGRVAQAETDARMTAEILAWSRARGLFAGIALNGATMREDDDWNEELYGKPLKNREIVDGSIAAPKSAAPLMQELDRYSSRK